MANAGTMTKSTHCGHAAALGLESALLAARGFTANVAVFEAAQGYVPALYDDGFSVEEMLGFGRAPFRIVEPGYAIKMFPSQFGTHFGITAALELHPNIPDAAAIRRVLLTAPVMAYVNRPRPKTGLEGKFSLQYTAASALLDGKVGIRTFTDARLASADMQDLLGKFEVRLDPAIPGRFEDIHVLLRVELDGGRVLETRCDGPRGKWGTPPISEAEHLVKIRDCLATRLEPAAVERVIGLARQIDDLDAAGVRQLMQACRLLRLTRGVSQRSVVATADGWGGDSSGEAAMLTLAGIFMIVVVALLSNKEQRKGAWLLAAVVILLVIIARLVVH